VKNIFVSLLLAGAAAFSANAHIAPSVSDTDAAYMSPNIIDTGSWDMSEYKSSIDTGTSLKIPNTNGSGKEIKANVSVLKDGTNDYPWVSLDCALDSAKNFVGVTTIRVTYKADQNWYLSLNDTTIDQDFAGTYQAMLWASTAFKTVYLNVLDTNSSMDSSFDFTQPTWSAGYTTPINYVQINGLTFGPDDDEGLGVSSTIEISDIRIYHYAGYTTSVKYTNKSLKHFFGTMNLVRSNVLAFSVPQDNNYTVSIYSAQGKLSAAMSKFCSKDGQNQIALKDLGLCPGLYLVKIAKADYSIMGKILVK
jgi:hypothetical protein